MGDKEASALGLPSPVLCTNVSWAPVSSSVRREQRRGVDDSTDPHTSLAPTHFQSRVPPPNHLRPRSPGSWDLDPFCRRRELAEVTQLVGGPTCV